MEDALEEAEALSELIGQHHPGSFVVGTAGGELAGVMYAIVLDHRAATLLLLRYNARSAAFALARSTFEAYVKGLWAQHCATEADIERLYEKRRLPTIETMSKQLDKFPLLRKQIGPMKARLWEPLSDFAHGGPRQFFRWTKDGEIEPRHTDEEVLDLLVHLNLHALLACMGMTMLAGQDGEVFRLKSLDVLAKARARKEARQSA